MFEMLLLFSIVLIVCSQLLPEAQKAGKPASSETNHPSNKKRVPCRNKSARAPVTALTVRATEQFSAIQPQRSKQSSAG